jgi:hypothetical protein
MKRGLITWDKEELSPAVFERRLQRVRDFLLEQHLPALVVYSDLWRSNPARFFSNYMPYFNRALLIIPLVEPPTLLCALSPRVYGWIRSVTTIEDVRPAGNFVGPLFQLAAERKWNRIGCLEFEQFPCDLHQALRSESLPVVSVDAAGLHSAGSDSTELAMMRKAAILAKKILSAEMPAGAGQLDHHFTGKLEQKFRRAGAEDLIVLLTNGNGPPVPPIGAALRENFSVSLAVEYRGHWTRISRPHASDDLLVRCQRTLDDVLGGKRKDAVFENLTGSYPYESVDASGVTPPSIVAVHVACEHAGARLFYGETCICGPSGFKSL